MKVSSVGRLRVISICFCLFAFLLIFRLYTVQIVQGAQFSERGNKQYVRYDENLFNRGAIFFQDKNGSLPSAASIGSGYIFAVNPTLIKNAEEAYDKLSILVSLDRTSFLSKALKENDTYEEILKRVDEATKNKIETLNIPGLLLFSQKWRIYPSGNSAAHLLGFIADKDGVVAGRYGLERYYEDVLHRESGGLYVNFFAEIFSNLKDTVGNGGKQEGDIVTTIEPTAQSFLERELLKINEKWSPDTIGGIIINPQNGEVYAMAAYPTFNPNSFQTEKNPQVFVNPLVESVYEMGSIIKPLTLAAGLDSGAVTAGTTYNDKGFLVLNNSKISNYDGKGHGIVDMQEVLSKSLNTGAAYVVTAMGKENFAHYMKSFKIGEETGIDLPNETFGLIDNLDSPRDIEHATASYGQGVAFSPIATVRALSSLGNGGFLINPHIVRKINYKTGLSKKVAIDEGTRVLKKETSEEITRMLVKVVDEALLNGKAKIEHYSVAAKTGTAQVAKTDGGGYEEGKYFHSFFGYFPAYDPEFLVFLFVMNPKGVQYASETLTRPFIDITKFLINYYEVPFDR
ncbi:MAG: penicillin-binding protein 2 [Patescibacteria group bacterium]